MADYEKYLDPEQARSLCDQRIDAICREAFAHHLTSVAAYAMDNAELGLHHASQIDSLNLALASVLEERAKWEVDRGDDDR